MYGADASTRPAAVLIVLMLLGIGVITILNPSSMTPQPVPASDSTPAMPTPTLSVMPATQSEVEKNDAAQKALALETARIQATRQVWLATAEVHNTQAVQTQSAVNAQSTEMVNRANDRKSAAEYEQQTALMNAAVILSVGTAVGLVIILLGVILRTLWATKTEKDIAQAARLEQEQRVVEAHAKRIEAKTKQLEAQLRANKVYANDRDLQSKQPVEWPDQSQGKENEKTGLKHDGKRDINRQSEKGY
jgi:hypothetical protein